MSWLSLQELLSTAPVDTATFMLWVHQNMPQFCADVDELDECLEAICDADRMKTDDDLVSRCRVTQKRSS